LELGKFNKAIACFDTVLKISPKNLRVMTAKGIALREQGNNTEALAYFDAVLMLNPLNSFVWKNRTMALRNLGRITQSQKCLQNTEIKGIVVPNKKTYPP